jgi:hypothetical protein
MTRRIAIVLPAPITAWLGAALCLLAAGACGGVSLSREGRLEAVWTGSDKGRMAAPATAIWCREARIAQVSGLIGDTGVSLLIHPDDSVAEGRYRIVDPDSARNSRAAAIGLRLLGQTAVVGYQGRSGWLTIERVARGRLSGQFESTAKVVTALAGTVKLSGRFQNVPVRPGGSACPP